MKTAPHGAQAKWALLEIAFLSICFLSTETDAHILVYQKITNQLIEEYNDLPAQFGPSLPPNGIKVYAIAAIPAEGCTAMQPPPRLLYPSNAKFVAIIRRGGADCTFELKVRNAQAAHFNAVIVFNNEGDDLEQMSAQNSTGIVIPAVFVGHTTGTNLLSFQTSEVVLVINDELPFNINTQLILPFSILIGLCFLIMIFYMIYKCIREERRLRRYRLPKSMLKKLPILKYTKNNDLSYDTCVICLDEFVEGDKLRVLPCRHPYHSHCIDPWLTENRRVCPVCKRKVFTKGEARSNRNRQSSLDSVTDTDDDTTPLLQPSSGGGGSSSNVNGVGISGGVTTQAIAAATEATTTHHGTFRRVGANYAAIAATADGTSDEENVLSSHQSHNSRRVNPFDRTPNLPPHLAEQLNESRSSIWSRPIFRFFRRQQPISVAAPPFLEEVVNDGGHLNTNTNTTASTTTIASTSLPRSIVQATTALPAAATAASLSSNNILNPNLSGSFNDDDNDEPPHRSIYEPIATVTPTPTPTVNVTAASRRLDIGAADSVFIHTPSRGGIGVVALPNTNDEDMEAAAASDRQFLI